MHVSEEMIRSIVKEVMAKMQSAEECSGKHGVFTDMNEAIAAAKEAQKIVRNLTMDQREKIISIIRKKTKEHAETMARMGVEETGMGNVGDKILGTADWLRAAIEIVLGAESTVVVPDVWQIDLNEFPALRDLKYNTKLWPIFNPDLKDNYLSDRERLQSWTIRLPKDTKRLAHE